MSNHLWVTFETGERSVDEVEAELREALTAWEDDPFWSFDEPTIEELRGNVVLKEFASRPTFPNVEVPRLVQTNFSDGTDTGRGKLWERIGGRFVLVDEMYSAAMGVGPRVTDYFRINYGFCPAYGYELETSVGTDERVTAEPEWQSVLSKEDVELPVEPETLADWIEMDPWDEEADLPEPGRVAPLVDYDAYYPAVARLLGRLVDTPPPETVENMTADDPEVRNRAIRQVAAVGPEEVEQYEQLLTALPQASERTRALIGSMLWQPAPMKRDEVVAAPSLVSIFADLMDDAVPEVRAGALMGAVATMGAIQEGRREEDLGDEVLEEVLDPFYALYASALSDRDVRVRERAAQLLQEPMRDHYGHVLNDDFLMQIDFPDRWRIARRLAAASAEEDAATDENYGDYAFDKAFRGDPSNVPALVEYAYETCGPYCETVRGLLAEVAEDDPEAVADALEPALSTVRREQATVQDLELLAALASEYPERVAGIARELEAMVRDASAEDGDASDKQRAASRVLNRLPEEATTVDRAELLDANRDVVGEDGELKPDRVASLADVDPDAASDVLVQIADEIQRDPNNDEGFFAFRVHEAFERVSAMDTEPIAAVLPELQELIETSKTPSEETVVAFARTGFAHPEALVDHVDLLERLLGDAQPVVREAAASLLVEVADVEPAAVTGPVEALAERPDDAIGLEQLEELWDRTDLEAPSPADWPLGTLAAVDRSFAVETVVEQTPDGHVSREDMIGVLREVDHGDPQAAEQLFAELLERRHGRLLWTRMSGEDPVTRLADKDPAFLARVVEPLVGKLMDPPFDIDSSHRDDSFLPSGPAKSIRLAIERAAEVDGEAVRDAVEESFGTLRAYVDTLYAPRRRDAARERLKQSE